MADNMKTVNPFIITDNAKNLMDFIEKVFDGTTDENALTMDKDGLILHAEMEIGDSLIMLVDRKPDWPFTPAFIQVYVDSVEETLAKAKDNGATVITEPTEYIGVKFSRISDMHKNIWWVYEMMDDYDWSQDFNMETGEVQENDRADYIRNTIVEAMNRL